MSKYFPLGFSALQSSPEISAKLIKEDPLPKSKARSINDFPQCITTPKPPKKELLNFDDFLPGDPSSIEKYAEHKMSLEGRTYQQLPCMSRAKQKRASKSTEPQAQMSGPHTAPPDLSEGIGRNQSKKDFARLESYIKEKQVWMAQGETLYHYDGTQWKAVDKLNTIRAIKEIFLQHQEILESLNERDYQELYSRLLTDPLLYREECLTSPVDRINCKDGTIDLSYFPPRKFPHDPEDCFTSSLPLTCEEILDPPMDGCYFESFISSVSDEDPAVRRQLLELIAIALTGLQVKHFYVMLGPSDSGKSQVGRFLLELLGSDNVATVRDMNDFGDKWTPGSLAGKRLGLCMDLPDAPLSKAAVGIIKQLCGADAVKGEQKYEKSFTYREKPLLLLGGNHAIRVPNADREEAFLNRMIIIPFTRAVPRENRVLDFYKKLLDEAPYIVHEAILAYQDLVDRNYELTRAEVPQVYSPQESNASYSTIYDFVERCLASEEGAEIKTSDIYDRFCTEDISAGISAVAFCKLLPQALKRMFPEAVPVKRVQGTEARGYKNIVLADVP